MAASKASVTELRQMPVEKYRRLAPSFNVAFDERWSRRSWPERQLTKAPRWCSVDLRDGNQALINPMDHEKKLRLFKHLLALGYKEIEVGFPAASQTDFDFIRHIIDEGLIPKGVWIQVLTQARDPLIRRTIEGVRGARNVILHIYNSTSELQRRVVFRQNREAIKALAVEGATLLKRLADEELSGTNVSLEYSPESFTGTELDFALEVSEAVLQAWRPTPEKPMILNLPATVEMTSPNVYADQIEWMCAHLSRRDCVCLSVHPHNDRGTGVAAAELALLAGADRVEGCLFGNGERTGNVCLVTLALNLFTLGVDPEVRFSDIAQTIDVVEHCTELRVPERHPWAGSLVYTAFSGSHQDAIKKGLQAMNRDQRLWEVPYLPIDPADLGRSYEAIIRVNSQSGKGGMAYLLESEYGIALPKDAQANLAAVVQRIADHTGCEISPEQIYKAFRSTFIEPDEPLSLVDYGMSMHADDLDAPMTLTARICVCGETVQVRSEGNGPLSGFVRGLNEVLKAQGLSVELASYESVPRGKTVTNSASEAVCTVLLQVLRDQEPVGKPQYGVGLHGNTTTAALRAVLSAINCLAAAGRLDLRRPLVAAPACLHVVPMATAGRLSRL